MGKKKIAIDGPAGAGKSTVARLVAQRLGYLYIDTGAMYRAITYKALLHNIIMTDQQKLTNLAINTNITLLNEKGLVRVFCDGQDVTEKIRSPEVSCNVSLVALIPGVRHRMVELQRQMAQDGGVVMDGRDIGTEVLPDADCKIFLTASVEKRAQRRCKEFEDKGFSKTLANVKSEIIQRDSMDINRDTGPLIKTPDAHWIDSTQLTIEQVVNIILEMCGEGDSK